MSKSGQVFRVAYSLRISLRPVSAYHQLLTATVDYLQQQKARGQRCVVVDPAKLAALTRPPQAAQPQIAPAPQASPVGAKTDSFAALREMVLGCTQCPNLASSRKNVVFGVGNEVSRHYCSLVKPRGRMKTQQGEPFVGKAGQLLTKIIETMGLYSVRTFTSPTFSKCRPDTPGKRFGNRPPTTDDEMVTCSPWLHRQIEFIQPKDHCGAWAKPRWKVCSSNKWLSHAFGEPGKLIVISHSCRLSTLPTSYASSRSLKNGKSGKTCSQSWTKLDLTVSKKQQRILPSLPRLLARFSGLFLIGRPHASKADIRIFGCRSHGHGTGRRHGTGRTW